MCEVRVEMKENVTIEDVNELKKVARDHVSVDFIKKRRYLKFMILLDSGASVNCLNEKLRDFICYKSQGLFNEKISGVHGARTAQIEHAMIDLTDDNGRYFRVKVRFLPNLRVKQTMSEVDKLLIGAEMNMTPDVADQMIWPD